MPTYTVSAVKTTYLTATVTAESLEEAERIADEELIVDDFEVEGTDFKLEPVVEKN